MSVSLLVLTPKKQAGAAHCDIDLAVVRELIASIGDRPEHVVPML